MKDLIINQFEGCQVRSEVRDDGSIWFVAKDVCLPLGTKYHEAALRRLDESQRGVISIRTLGGNQQVSAVNESGMYSLVLSSRKPQAKKFMLWVAGTVLPNLRKNGTFSINQPVVQPADDLDSLLESIRTTEKVVVALQVARTQIKATEQKLEVHEQKFETVDEKLHELSRGISTVRKGPTDGIPDGFITLDRIRQRYFQGVSKPVISKYLHSKGHPSVPHRTIPQPGAEEVVHILFKDYGLEELVIQMVRESRLEKQTELNWKMTHPVQNYWIKKSEASDKIAKELMS